jgi:hypothetical protein
VASVATPNEAKITSNRGNSANINKDATHSPGYNKSKKTDDVNKSHNQLLRSQDLKKTNQN